jgi:hypothetical protein
MKINKIFLALLILTTAESQVYSIGEEDDFDIVEHDHDHLATLKDNVARKNWIERNAIDRFHDLNEVKNDLINTHKEYIRQQPEPNLAKFNELGLTPKQVENFKNLSETGKLDVINQWRKDLDEQQNKSRRRALKIDSQDELNTLKDQANFIRNNDSGSNSDKEQRIESLYNQHQESAAKNKANDDDNFNIARNSRITEFEARINKLLTPVDRRNVFSETNTWEDTDAINTYQKNIDLKTT